MTESSKNRDEDRFEKYLDQQISQEQQLEVEQSLTAGQRLDVHLQNEIDASLIRQHQTAVPSLDEIESWLGKPAAASPRPKSARRVLMVALAALAASILAMFLFFPRTKPTPFFEPRALAKLYTESVDAGFEPYYFCEDDERFAATFDHRQGQRLVLASLPDDRHMLGLSYLGGLSRSSTAILCMVNEQPVIVFVDRIDMDNDAITEAVGGLHVHRESRDGLVFYEVSPHATPRITPFLKKTK